MGRRGLLVAALAAGALVAGCGDEESTAPTFSGTDEEQIAGTVNAMTGAIAAGDGELACGLMTDAGQALMLEMGRQAGGDEVTGCEAAVPAVEAIGFDPGDFRVKPADVSAGAEGAEANCDLQGAFILTWTDAGWRVDVPYCSY